MEIVMKNNKFNKNIEQNWSDKGIIRIDKVTQLCGLYGAVIHKSMFDALLSLPANNPWDCQLNQYHESLLTFYIQPKMIHTRSTYSHCEGNIINRIEL